MLTRILASLVATAILALAYVLPAGAQMQWTRLGDPLPLFQQSITTILPLSETVLLAGVDNGGIFRSTDRGVTWMRTSEYQPSRLTLTYSGTIVALGAGEIGLSTDGGSQWSFMPIDSQGTSVTRTMIDSSDRIFALGGNGTLFRSVDNGRSWQIVREADSGSAYGALAASNSGGVYLSSGDLLLVSYDGGEHWDELAQVAPGLRFEDLAIAIDGTLFSLMAPTSGGRRSLYRSTDNGITWQFLRLGFLMPIESARNGALYVGDWMTALLATDDGGAHWSAINEGLPGSHATQPMVTALAADARGTLYCGTMDGMILRREPVSSAVPRERGLGEVILFSMNEEAATPAGSVAPTR